MIALLDELTATVVLDDVVAHAVMRVFLYLARTLGPFLTNSYVNEDIFKDSERFDILMAICQSRLQRECTSIFDEHMVDGFDCLTDVGLAQVSIIVLTLDLTQVGRLSPCTDSVDLWLSRDAEPAIRAMYVPGREVSKRAAHFLPYAVLEVISGDRQEDEMKTIYGDDVTHRVKSFVQALTASVDAAHAERMARELLAEEEASAPPSRRRRKKERRAKRATARDVTTVVDALERAAIAVDETVEETVVAPAEEVDERTLCVVCLDGPRTHLVAPCGHKCLCEACSTRVGATCPMCRGSVALVCRVYE